MNKLLKISFHGIHVTLKNLQILICCRKNNLEQFCEEKSSLFWLEKSIENHEAVRVTISGGTGQWDTEKEYDHLTIQINS